MDNRDRVNKKLIHWNFFTNCERILKTMTEEEKQRKLSYSRIKFLLKNSKCIYCKMCLGQKTLDEW